MISSIDIFIQKKFIFIKYEINNFKRNIFFKIFKGTKKKR